MKRVSLQVRDTKVSGYFAHHETAIYDALVDDSSPARELPRPDRGTRGSLDAYYVSDRGLHASPEHIQTILDRLPTEFGEIYRRTVELRKVRPFHEEVRLDYFELDFIDFLLNTKKNRVIRLVGSVGAGKSTFLAYMFQCIRRRTNSLLRFLPIIINFTRYPQHDLDKDDFAEMIWRSLRASLEEEAGDSKPPRRANVTRLLNRVIQHGLPAARRNGLYSLMHFIRETFATNDEIEPIFIFDNLDHLAGESVARIAHFSRALFLETRCCNILAMRPPALATYAEIDAHKGAFYTFMMELPPPDLRSIFARRLKHIIRKEAFSFEVEGTQVTFQVDDVETAVRNVIDNVLDADSQRLLLEGVANRNIRKAARAFTLFLRWPGLRPDLLVSGGTRETRRALPGGFYEHLLTGIMLGSQLFFRDNEEDRPIVTNVFNFVCPNFPADYLIQYKILSLLDWAVKVIPTATLVDWMMVLGYHKSHVVQCIEHLLRRGLICSPESEGEFARAKHVSQSHSGAFYLAELIANDQYVFQAIPDVTLRHEHLTAKDRNQFVGRMYSILELIERVEYEEKHKLEIALKTKYAPQILGALERSGFLQHKLILAARKLTNFAFRSEHESVRDAAPIFEKRINYVKARTEAAERLLMQHLIGANLIPPEPHVPAEVFRCKWGGQYELEMRAPAFLSPANPNIVEVECQTGKDEDAESIFGRIEDVINGGFDEITELRRQGGSDTFTGQFVLPWRDKVKPLPNVRLSLFAGSRPLFRQMLKAQPA